MTNTAFTLGALHGTRVLVVDDMSDERMLLASYLEQQACRVFLAKDGQDAINKALIVKPDLILLDVRMPVCDGLTACRMMQDDPRLRETPVIFLTGASLPEDRVAGLLAGAVDYISKPFNLEEIRLRLSIHLGRRQKPAEEFEPKPALHPVSNLDNILFQTARVRILKKLSDEPDLNSLAQSVGTNSRRLNEAFKNCVGVTVFGYLREARMREARKLLADTALEVQSIAQELGYTSGANFATAFKERFGMSPIQFRQERAGTPP